MFKCTPVFTELKFAASDAQATKKIVLTPHPNAGYEYGSLHQDGDGATSPYEEAVTVGLYPDGELVLPPYEQTASYGTGDLFTLKVIDSTRQIILYKNDDPFTSYNNPWAGHPLYAEVWLKEPDSAVLAVATREAQEAVTGGGGETDGNLRQLLRGRMNEYR
ncbi:MAG: hypothetical protein SGARI_003577 [Bacillariaceae sp.]